MRRQPGDHVAERPVDQRHIGNTRQIGIERQRIGIAVKTIAMRRPQRPHGTQIAAGTERRIDIDVTRPHAERRQRFGKQDRCMGRHHATGGPSRGSFLSSSSSRSCSSATSSASSAAR